MKDTYLTPEILVEQLCKTDVLLASSFVDNRNISGSGLESFLGPEAEDNQNISGFSLERFL